MNKISKISVVFMGSSSFSISIFEELIASPHIQVKALITQPDKKIGRKQTRSSPFIKLIAEKHKIPVYQPYKNADIEFILEKINPDFSVVASYGMILSLKALKIPKFGSINVHPSLLPLYRGASPIQFALLNGDKETGVSIIQMNEKLDSGDILCVSKMPIFDNETGDDLSKRLSELAAKMLPDTLLKITKGNIFPQKQDNKKASYCKKLDRVDGFLDFKSFSAHDLYNKFRAFYPWPGCALELNGKRIKVLDAGYNENTDLKSGEWFFGKNIVRIGTKKGEFLPKIVQMEGKKPIDIAAFLRGFRHFI